MIRVGLQHIKTLGKKNLFLYNNKSPANNQSIKVNRVLGQLLTSAFKLTLPAAVCTFILRNTLGIGMFACNFFIKSEFVFLCHFTTEIFIGSILFE